MAVKKYSCQAADRRTRSYLQVAKKYCGAPLSNAFYLITVKTAGFLLSSSNWQVCFTYCQKQSCQVVTDKPILLTIKNTLVKLYLTSLFYLLSKITLSSSTWQRLATAGWLLFEVAKLNFKIDISAILCFILLPGSNTIVYQKSWYRFVNFLL